MPIIYSSERYIRNRICKETDLLSKENYEIVYIDEKKIIVKKEDYLFEIDISKDYPFYIPTFYFYSSLYKKKRYIDELYKKHIILYETYDTIKEMLYHMYINEENEKSSFLEIIEVYKTNYIKNKEDNEFISYYENMFTLSEYRPNINLYDFINHMIIILKKMDKYRINDTE